MKFLDPDTVQLLKFADAKEILAPLELKSTDLIFFPVNDNETNSCGGSHWSLLIYLNGKFIHYDSGLGMNQNEARKLAENFAPVVGIGENFVPVAGIKGNFAPVAGNKGNFDPVVGEKSLESFEFLTPSCPQQNNGHDCGIFVIMFSEKIAEEFSKSDKGFEVESIQFGNLNPTEERIKLQQLIDELRKEKN